MVLLGLASSAQAASLTMGVSDTTPTVGQTVTVSIRLSSSTQASNAAQGSLIFPPSVLSLKSISRSGSIFSFWTTEPTGSDSTGRVTFSGGIPNPGYKGSGGLIFIATFTAKAVGTASLSMTGGKILANDGYGTDIFSGSGSATITVAAASTPTTPTTPPAQPAVPGKPSPTITPAAFPQPNTWYPGNTSNVNFSHGGGYIGTSYVVDQNPNTDPGQSANTTSGSAIITLTTDGVWYVHARNQYATGWSSTTTIILRRDTTPPEPFTITVTRDRGDADPTPTLTFSAKDATSGIAGYTISIDGQTATPTNSPVTLPALMSGSHEIVIVASDQSGNKQTAKVIVNVTGYSAPTIDSASSPMVLLDNLVVRGKATNGDTITVMMDGNILGQAIAGKIDPGATASGVMVPVPWFFSTDQLIRPGRHAITVSAKSVDGKTSITSDPTTLIVTGNSIVLGGRPIATIALAPVAAIIAALIIIANALVLGKLWLSFRGLYQREEKAEEDLEALRQRMGRGPISADEVERDLYDIEAELVGTRPVRPPRRRRRKRGSA